MSEKGISFSTGKNQDASGVLKDSDNAKNHPFEKSIEPLEIAEIQHFSRIPDFIDPTRSPYPIVVKSPSSLQCIDGWELIAQAKNRGATALICEVIHIQRDSEIEIAICKASTRTMPLGGRCSYPEEMGNTCRIFAMLRESLEDPVVFSHGGARRGDSYENRRENNIRLVLAERLGKSITTINKYLNHGEFLSEAALQALIRAGVKKGLFEAIQKDKQQLIDDLKSEEKSHDEIVNAVSARVLSRLEQFQACEPPEIVKHQNEKDDPPAVQSQSKKDSVKPAAAKPIKHKHWSGNPSAVPEKQPTKNEICQQFAAIGQLLIETAENPKLTTQDRIEIFSDQIPKQWLLIQRLKYLLARQSKGGEEQS